MDFDSLPEDSPAPQQISQRAAAPAGAFDSLPDDSDKYSGFGQQALGAAESVARGVPFGHTLTNIAERGLTKLGVPGLTPEESSGREAYLQSVNPALTSVGNVAGFAASTLAGAAPAKALGALGEGAVSLAGYGEAAKNAAIGAKLAAGSIRAGTELAALQADDEVSRAINKDPNQSIGSAVADIGLAGLLGGIGGGTLTGLGLAGKGALNAVGIQDFANRLAERGAMDISPGELAQKEFSEAHQTIRNMGTELGGINGVGAAARDNLMPELHPGMTRQADDLASQIEAAADKLQKRGDQSGALNQLREQAEKIREAINPNPDLITMQPQNPVSASNIYDTMNSVKRQLGEWAHFDARQPPPLSEIPFRNSAKQLGFGLKTALEDRGIWGEVGALQKSLNSAWSASIPAMKDAESKFMQRIGGSPETDPAKFATYFNQNGKATSQTVRQKMMQNFVESAEKFQNAVSDAYEKAGLESPHPVMGLGSLKESYGEQSIGHKLADLWHDKLGATALGNAAGMAAGQAVSPGIGGIYAGKWVLGPMFGSVIKPIAERAANLSAYQGMMRFVKSAAAGESKLTKAVGALFEGSAKTLPSHWIPDLRRMSGLDDALKRHAQDLASLEKVPGNMGHYLPAHATAAAQTAANAINVLNAQRPSSTKAGILDKEVPPSKEQEALFQRKLLVAEQPLVCLQHAKDGTILPQDVSTIKSLYPQYYDHLCSRVMGAVANQVNAGKDIPYRTRQGLSLLLGQPLDSTMSAQSIQAVQQTFASAAPQQQAQAAQRVKRGSAPLSKLSNSLQTASQARESRQNKTG